jgi:serine/threonine protein kinase
LRSSGADYQVIEALVSGSFGGARYLCQPPPRFAGAEAVMVTELAVDASGWPQLADLLTRITAIGSDVLLELLEIGPDLHAPGSGAGVYVVSEPTPGGSLADPDHSLSTGEVLTAVANAAEAAHELHQSGLAHGSIDGRAIVFTGRGAVLAPPALDLAAGVLAQFGVSREISTVDPDLLCGETATRGSDIWSLGATVHDALSSVSLYEGIEDDEPVTAVQRVLFSRPVVDQHLPRGVVDLVTACLEADPAARPTTALEVAERLRVLGERS